MQERSHRQLRVGEEIRHSIAHTLRKGRFHDEALLDAGGRVTVSEVRVSPDLKHATAYVLILGGGEMEHILVALNGAAGYFQSEINRHIKMKFTPKLKFVTDDSFDEVQKIDRIIRELPHRRYDDGESQS